MAPPILYAASEGIFRSTPPINAGSNSFLVTMIAANNLDRSRTNRAAGRFQRQHVSHPARCARRKHGHRPQRPLYRHGNAIFNTRLRSNCTVERVNAFTNAGLEMSPCPRTSLAIRAEIRSFFGVATNSFVSGAMADNLTSFGGQIFENSEARRQSLSLSWPRARPAVTARWLNPCNYTTEIPRSAELFLSGPRIPVWPSVTIKA